MFEKSTLYARYIATYMLNTRYIHAIHAIHATYIRYIGTRVLKKETLYARYTARYMLYICYNLRYIGTREGAQAPLFTLTYVRTGN